jgi:hypothetical protein
MEDREPFANEKAITPISIIKEQNTISMGFFA